MLNDLRIMFRNSWEAFQREHTKREPADEVAALLAAMRREMVAARAALPEYAEAAQAAAAELDKERKAIADCQRRLGLAERIGDGETARVAGEFLERHQQRAAVLETKLEAARAERELREREAREMMSRYKEADANRFALLSQVRAHRARETMRQGDGEPGTPFDDFDRMADIIDDNAAYADVAEELGAMDERPDRGAPASAESVEQRLRELKERMQGS